MPHLATTGQDLFDAWRPTGMAAPETIATSIWCRERGTREDLELWTEVDDGGDRYGCRKEATAGSTLKIGFESRHGDFTSTLSALVFQAFPTGSPPTPSLPDVWFDRTDVQLTVPNLPPNGIEVVPTVPAGVSGATLRAQAIVVSFRAANGLYASSDTHDPVIR